MCIRDSPQTTRNRIMGVCTDERSQIVFLDTPGLHTPHSRLGESMVKAAHDALSGIDALLVMVDATAVGKQDPVSYTQLFPGACGAAGETRRETLLRKASESTAHVAGFGMQLGGLRPCLLYTSARRTGHDVSLQQPGGGHGG